LCLRISRHLPGGRLAGSYPETGWGEMRTTDGTSLPRSRLIGNNSWPQRSDGKTRCPRDCKLLHQRLICLDDCLWGVVGTYLFTHWWPVHRGSRIKCPTRLVLAALFLGQAFSSTGCSGAPSITIAGAYFPAWLLCAVIAVLAALVIRAVMVATGLANYIPYQLAVCCSAGAILGLILWQLWVVR